jgi:type II secretory pathway component GspD/PulD (secretin)
MKANVKLVLGLAIGMTILGGAPSVAMAQEDLNQKQISSLELNQADVREALRSLFKDVNGNYSVAPDVQGQVTVSLKKVTLEVALQNILRQVDATYRIEAGVYVVVRKQVTIAPPTSEPQGGDPRPSMTITRRIKIRSADPYLIAMMLGAKKGSQNYSMAPETSTIAANRGAGGGSGIGGGNNLGGGQGNGFGNSGTGFGNGSGIGGNTGSGRSGGGGGFGF